MKDQITQNSKINELRLFLIDPQNQNKLYILVEGESDIKLYRKLFGRNVEVKSVNGGYANLQKCLSILVKDFDKIIGIRDADFAHLEKEVPILKELFFTDLHDLEMSLIETDETFLAVLNEHVELLTSDLCSIRNMFLNTVKFIGYLRWYNYRNKLDFNFRKLNFSELIDPESVVADNEKCLHYILNRSHSNRNDKEILVGIEKLQGLSDELNQICSGHDVTGFMAVFINSRAKKAVSSERIESELRIAYSLKNFQTSKLYLSLLNWGNRNSIALFDL